MGDDLVLVLDDYHVIDAKPVDDTLTFLLEHLPRHMRLVIGTREDPQLPLARLRGRGQLSELRVTAAAVAERSDLPVTHLDPRPSLRAAL